MNTFHKVMLCSVVAVFQSFRATYYLLVQGRRVTNAKWSTRKKYQTTWCGTTEDMNLLSHHCKNRTLHTGI